MNATRRRLLLLIAAATIAIDLTAKAAAVRWLNDPIDLGIIIVRATENSGVAFGIGADQTTALVVALTGIAVAAIGIGAWRGLLGGPIGAGLILGGGAANLLDRLVGGSVIDLLDLGWWPVFNPADVALTIGVALTILSAGRDEHTAPVQPAKETPGP